MRPRWPLCRWGKQFTIALLKTVPIDGFGQADPAVFIAQFSMVRRQIVINRHLLFFGTVHRRNPSLQQYGNLIPLEQREDHSQHAPRGLVQYQCGQRQGGQAAGQGQQYAQNAADKHRGSDDDGGLALALGSTGGSFQGRPQSWAKLPRCSMLPSLSGSQAVAGFISSCSAVFSTFTAPAAGCRQLQQGGIAVEIVAVDDQRQAGMAQAVQHGGSVRVTLVGPPGTWQTVCRRRPGRSCGAG